MENLLKIEHVKQVFGGLVALQNINISVCKGEIVGVIGPNGAGKTTLFNIVTGFYTPTEGSVSLNGQTITGKRDYEITSIGIARTFQNIRLFKGLTVLDNILIGMHARTKNNLLGSVAFTKKFRAEEKARECRAEEIMALLDLNKYRYYLASNLPYGLQRRLEIARALATEPTLLLLDEPVAGMNEQETEDMRNIILELRDLGYSILLIEHDMRFVMNICDRLYVLNYGKQIADGTPAEVKNNQLVIDAYLGEE